MLAKYTHIHSDKYTHMSGEKKFLKQNLRKRKPRNAHYISVYKIIMIVRSMRLARKPF